MSDPILIVDGDPEDWFDARFGIRLTDVHPLLEQTTEEA